MQIILNLNEKIKVGLQRGGYVILFQDSSPSYATQFNQIPKMILSYMESQRFKGLKRPAQSIGELQESLKGMETSILNLLDEKIVKSSIEELSKKISQLTEENKALKSANTSLKKKLEARI